MILRRPSAAACRPKSARRVRVGVERRVSLARHHDVGTQLDFFFFSDVRALFKKVSTRPFSRLGLSFGQACTGRADVLPHSTAHTLTSRPYSDSLTHIHSHVTRRGISEVVEEVDVIGGGGGSGRPHSEVSPTCPAWDVRLRPIQVQVAGRPVLLRCLQLSGLNAPAESRPLSSFVRRWKTLTQKKTKKWSVVRSNMKN
jgi:hypothetical protein